MVNGPGNNLHGGGDLCKSKAGKIYTHANDSSCQPDNTSHRMRAGHRNHKCFDFSNGFVLDSWSISVVCCGHCKFDGETNRFFLIFKGKWVIANV